MAEYVEKKDVKAVIKRRLGKMDLFESLFNADIDAMPAADVAPVVRAKWIPCDPDSDVRFYCSECGTEISTSWDYDCDEMWNGCPHCLARMDGE